MGEEGGGNMGHSMTVNNHWTGQTGMELLEWNYWTDLFALKSFLWPIMRFPLHVKLHPAQDQSVITSSISLYREPHIFKVR